MDLSTYIIPGSSEHIAGAFTVAGTSVGLAVIQKASYENREGTKLHLSSYNSTSVYTDSGKVYPLSLALNFIIKC